MNAPCKDCQDRQAGCHSECDRYQAYCAEREALRERRKKAIETDSYIIQKVRKLKKGNDK